MTDSNDQATIVVVDDTPPNLKLLDEMLNTAGYRVLSFTRGEHALTAISKNIPDLILLDINMPGLNGYQVCEKLKADKHLQEIPVLFISAYTEVEEKLKAFQVGGVDYVTKPFQEAEVLARIATHLEIRHQKLEIEKNYRELRELEGLRDNLTQMIVHDLRSPLTTMNGSLELLQSHFADTLSEQAARLVKAAVSSTSKMIELVSSLLDLNRLESGEFPLKREVCDIHTVLGEAIAIYQNSQKLITFQSNVSEELNKILADKELLRRVLVNLIGNAVKFSPREGVIGLDVERVDGEIRFAIRDRGEGIPKECHGLIFEKYGQVEIRAKHSGYSSGIGLAFCKLAVEAHGGSIWVESDVGKGCDVFFTLPGNVEYER